MGASVAYETALRLQSDGGTTPTALFVSARTAPGLPHHPFTYRTDAELLDHVQSLGGTDRHALRDPAILELVLPAIRADYHLVGNYRGQVGKDRLQTPVVGYYGDQDAAVDRDAVAGWSAVTGGSFVALLPRGPLLSAEAPT